MIFAGCPSLWAGEALRARLLSLITLCLPGTARRLAGACPGPCLGSLHPMKVYKRIILAKSMITRLDKESTGLLFIECAGLRKISDWKRSLSTHLGLRRGIPSTALQVELFGLLAPALHSNWPHPTCRDLRGFKEIVLCLR